MAPQLSSDFWSRVARQLVHSHDVPRPLAQTWTDKYRQELKTRGIGDAVYNRGEDAAAATIAAAIKDGGFPVPSRG